MSSRQPGGGRYAVALSCLLVALTAGSWGWSAAPKWAEAIGGDGDESAFSIQQTNDSGAILAGYARGLTSTEYSYDDIFVVKLDGKGAVKWQKAYWQGTEGRWRQAGYSESFGSGDADLWVIRTDKTGLINAACDATGDTVATVKDSTAAVSDYTAEVATTYATPVAGPLVAVTTEATTFVVCSGAASE